MKPLRKRTQLAIALVSQAFVLERLGTGGLDQKNLATLIALLRSAARSLDATVKGPNDDI
jgi:ABC-type phosphonate transport system ATPase subunit